VGVRCVCVCGGVCVCVCVWVCVRYPKACPDLCHDGGDVYTVIPGCNGIS